MRVFIRWLLVIGCGVAVTAHVLAQEASPYVLGVGDILSISVFEEPDMSVESARINDTGVISFPLLGEVKALGLTTSQLQQAIKKGLVPDYLIDPIINIKIVEHRPYFLGGEVAKPGSYEFLPGLTLRQALQKAGGITERGSYNKMTVVPEGKAKDPKGGKSKDGDKINLDDPIKPGDTITVDQSFF